MNVVLLPKGAWFSLVWWDSLLLCKLPYCDAVSTEYSLESKTPAAVDLYREDINYGCTLNTLLFSVFSSFKGSLLGVCKVDTDCLKHISFSSSLLLPVGDFY